MVNDKNSIVNPIADAMFDIVSVFAFAPQSGSF